MPPSEAEVREMVRRALSRVLATPAGAGLPTASPSASSVGASLPAARPSAARPKLIDEATVRSLPPGATLPIPPGALVTPLARQVAQERNITLGELDRRESRPSVSGDRPEPAAKAAPPQQRVALGADHGGYALKEALKPHLQSLGYQVMDCGTHSTDAVDYPDIAYAVARLVADGQCANGIIVDGAGIGSCMAANKVPGIRAALCYDHATAVNSREHNHANVLTLGAGLIGVNLAKQIVSDWLATPFGSGRHAKRVEKITAIEKRYRSYRE
jgi:ribose 5-phosphate isomerase B